jgi:FtsP/CotA-like multicopper oxidase with cupredoxin domain
MKTNLPSHPSRRRFLESAAVAAGALLIDPRAALLAQESQSDHTLRIKTAPIEIAPKRIISAITYNGQFPGPLLRFKEGQPVTVDIYNESSAPEFVHWHGLRVSSEVDGAAEEGTPFIPAGGMRRVSFTPNPPGFRFYHTHVRAGADLAAGLYGGLAGPLYIEPRHEAGSFDREFFLTLKEFEPSFSRGGDMAQDFLSPAAPDNDLKSAGESAMKASLAKGMPHGYEVGYRAFTINGRMLGHGEPLRVKQGERVLLHVLNASATEIRSLALPGHSFRVIALDGNPVPNPATVPVLWIGTAERVSAVVEMNHPGVWILGDLDDDDRGHGMGIVVEYAGRTGRPEWSAPPKSKSRWSYLDFAKPGAAASAPDETIEMTFAKQNAAEQGFNLWTINGVAFPMTASSSPIPAAFHLKEGKRYRIRMRNASDDIHPIHLHRHTFEIASVAGEPSAGVRKDVFMLNGYQEAAIDFVADNPGLTLFHCHQQLHMDFGFMTLFDYV